MRAETRRSTRPSRMRPPSPRPSGPRIALRYLSLWRCDVSDDLHDDLPLSRLVVQFQERDLLPGAEGGTAVDDRHCEARAEEGRAHMAVAVPVLPSTLMAVFHVLREEPLKEIGRAHV